MNAVGIDVSKNKSTVAILRPFGEIVTKPFDVKHTSSDITHLISQLKSLNGDTRSKTTCAALAGRSRPISGLS